MFNVQWKSVTFAAAFEQTRAVLYGQLPRNPPGWEHSKGTWL